MAQYAGSGDVPLTTPVTEPQITYDWVPFTGAAGALPSERKLVLVQIGARAGTCDHDAGIMPPCVAVGYMKFAAGDEDCPYFVIPGMGGPRFVVTHWCDCLPGIRLPGWSADYPLSVQHILDSRKTG